MTHWAKALVVFLIVVEVAGLALVGLEAKLLVDEKSMHWVGYIGAGLMSGGALFWAKIYITYIK